MNHKKIVMPISVKIRKGRMPSPKSALAFCCALAADTKLKDGEAFEEMRMAGGQLDKRAKDFEIIISKSCGDMALLEV